MNVTLSADDVIVGVIVSAQCQRGTAFPDGTLVKYLQCVDNTSSDVVSWNDSLAHCQGLVTYCEQSALEQH